jgi:hypothetical protein
MVRSGAEESLGSVKTATLNVLHGASRTIDFDRRM